MKAKPKKPPKLHFYTATLWCEVSPDGTKRIMMKSEFAYRSPQGIELSVPAHKRLWKWLKKACEWAET